MTNRTNKPLQSMSVLCLSGNVRTVLSACGFPPAESFQSVHEFIVAQPRKLLQLMRTRRSGFVVVVTKDLRYQRFRTIWKLYAAAAGMWRWTFADERGATDRFQWWRLLAIEIPLLGWELVQSLGALALGWLRLVRYQRWDCR
jgi:hypothetical protein